MKRNLFLCLMILMVMCCVGCASVKISEDDTTQDVTEDSSKDDDILAFLKTNNVINSDDTYMGVDQDIGILGREGNKRYVYKQADNGLDDLLWTINFGTGADNEFYYIEISECGFGSNGEFYGYKYKADETFYLITVIQCNYNGDAEFVSDVVTEVYGEETRYIVSGTDDNLQLRVAVE